MFVLCLQDDEGFKVSFQPLQPGKDLIFRVRVYRPFYYKMKDEKKSVSFFREFFSIKFVGSCDHSATT